MNTLVVTAPLAVVRLDNGELSYVYAGGAVPSNADPAHVEHLQDVGLVGPLEPAVDAATEAALASLGGGTTSTLGPVPTGASVPLATVGAPDVEATRLTSGQPESTRAPAKSAPKAEWETYAVSKGASAADASAATKDELVAQYG